MSPDELISLADNPNFIAGIYNYCDRWCEKCTATSKCLLFASTPPDDLQRGTNEEKQNAIFRQFEESFELTIGLLNKIAVEQGLDLNNIEAPDDWEHNRLRIDKAVKITSLSRLGKEYLDKARWWLDHCDEVVKRKDEELQQALLLQLPNRNPEQELIDLKNALDVLFWYCFQVSVKLMRAQMSREAENDDIEDAETYPKDSDGSAKVALIGIERSIGAWGLLLQQFPDEETKILEILSILQQLMHMTEKEFPAARTFFRPGLD